MGLFDGLDIASAEDDPFKVPAGKYKCVVVGAELGESANKNIVLKLTHSIVEGEEAGKLLTTRHTLPVVMSVADEALLSVEEQGKRKQSKSFLKKAMLDRGIPEGRINSVEPDDLIGQPVILTVQWKAGSDYPTIYSAPAAPGEVNTSAAATVSHEGNPFD